MLSAMDCILHKHGVIYCSSEMTTGLRLFQVLRNHGLSSVGDLKRQFGDELYREKIFDTNCRFAVHFAEEVRHRFEDRTLVITPAPFTAPSWNQDEYLAFWEALIRTRVNAVWFNHNWQYSNGCTFEFAVAVDAGIPLYDHRGATLCADEAVKLIHSAIKEIDQWGFETKRLIKNLAFIRHSTVRADLPV